MGYLIGRTSHWETVYTQLSMQRRRRIEGWWHAKVPVAEIAAGIEPPGSPRSFGEIKRNFWADDAFPNEVCWILRHWAAHQIHTTRRYTQRKLSGAPLSCVKRRMRISEPS